MASGLFYVQDTRQPVGDCALWWRPKGAGYTCELEDAGLYTAEEVGRLPRPTDVAWPREVVEAAARRHVNTWRLSAP